MSAPARFDDTLVAGDTYPMTLTLVGVDVLGGSAILHIRKRPEEPPVITSTGTLSSGGRIIFKLLPDETRRLDMIKEGQQRVIYNVQYTSAAGDVTTILAGQLRVLKDLAV